MSEFIIVVVLVFNIYDLICAVSEFNSSRTSDDLPKLKRKLWWKIFCVVVWLAILLGV